MEFNNTIIICLFILILTKNLDRVIKEMNIGKYQIIAILVIVFFLQNVSVNFVPEININLAVIAICIAFYILCIKSESFKPARVFAISFLFGFFISFTRLAQMQDALSVIVMLITSVTLAIVFVCDLKSAIFAYVTIPIWSALIMTAFDLLKNNYAYIDLNNDKILSVQIIGIVMQCGLYCLLKKYFAIKNIN